MNTTQRTPAAPEKTSLIALIGNPNSGKTTVFNRLTGLRQKVANYPGVTVERREGRLDRGTGARVLDLPGCYSLTPRSMDQRIARDALLGWTGEFERPDLVVVVVDATNLERNLFLATQVIELNLPTIVVCNMLDAARRRGIELDLTGLSERLGVPVVGTVASTGEGIDSLRSAIDSLGPNHPRPRAWSGGEALESVVGETRALIAEHGLVEPAMADAVAGLLVSPSVVKESETAFANLPRAFRDAFSAMLAARGGGVGSALASDAVQARYDWLGRWVGEVCRRRETGRLSKSDRVDRVVTHRLWGAAVFGAVMLALFLAIFSWAAPLMDAIDWCVGWVGSSVRELLGAGMLTDLLVDGVIAGVGNVVVFLPQICLLFLFIALLEDSGYMARVAFVMDRVMSMAGLHGKSFIPLLSSFACAVPAIMATRTIEDRRDRFATLLVAPLMSCSARLPVYVILISALFGTSIWLKTGIMLAMYALGTVTALLVALILKRTVLKGPTPTFILELPSYKLPRIGATLRTMWDQGRLFLTQAGTIILALSVVLWTLAYFPRGENATMLTPSEQLRHSYMGRMGRFIEPVIEPLGFDWKIGVGITASFAAREVFVATMGVVYGVEEAETDHESIPLREKMVEATWPDGRKVFTPLVGVSLMVFYVLACQCMSTLAVVKRETQSWRWPLFMFVYMTVLAYGASFAVYQGGKALGWG